MDQPPTVEQLRTLLQAAGPIDRASAKFAAVAGPVPDLARPAHRAALLDWLNAWSCRIPRGAPGEPAPFDESVAEWWASWSPRLPDPATPLAELADDDVVAVAAAYGDLCDRPAAARPVGRWRRVGPTAAAKALHAARPRAVVPWDAAIAAAFHGERTADAFARHQRMGRAWARAILAEAGVPEHELVDRLGRPGSTLARLIDEYQYAAVAARRGP